MGLQPPDPPIPPKKIVEKNGKPVEKSDEIFDLELRIYELQKLVWLLDKHIMNVIK